MNRCDIPGPGEAVSADSLVSDRGSRIHRFQPGATTDAPNLWRGVPVQQYKPAADHHCGVLRAVLVGDSGEKTRFQVRYFEIASGGFTTLEHHRHEHVVVVLRGQGQVRLGTIWHSVGFGDAVYVAPDEVHQLRNTGSEPFGFLCIVDSERDRPVAVDERAE
jgi:quercetin dioxygenase-like cupin family protein